MKAPPWDIHQLLAMIGWVSKFKTCYSLVPTKLQQLFSREIGFVVLQDYQNCASPKGLMPKGRFSEFEARHANLQGSSSLAVSTQAHPSENRNSWSLCQSYVMDELGAVKCGGGPRCGTGKAVSRICLLAETAGRKKVLARPTPLQVQRSRLVL